MSRTSRVPHPPGSRFVAVHHWVVTQWGLAEAAVLGLLDFLDRGQPTEGRPLASRKRIVADLEGIVGRDSVDRALRTLVGAGALKEHKTTTPGERNLLTRVDYALDIEGIARILNASGSANFRSPGDSENQEPQQDRNPVRKSGAPSSGCTEVDIAAARTSAGSLAAAFIEDPKRKSPRRAGYGIECWYPSEDLQAAQIIRNFSAEEIMSATTEIKRRPNRAGRPTSPVPHLVQAELDRLHSQAIAAKQRAAAEAAHQARLSIAPTASDLAGSQAAMERGEVLLAQIRQKRSMGT